MRILLVEDNGRLAELVAQGLKAGGFAVDSFATLADADAALVSVDYQAVILDLGLPDGDGLTLVKRARQRGQAIPMLVLTARDGVDDRVRGLDAGADDYVLKPFAMQELLARVRALLRRPGDVLGVVLSCGKVSLNAATREVRFGDAVVAMPRRETEMLEHLLRQVGRLVPKRVLEESLYGYNDDLSSNSVEAVMSRLRKRLGQAGADVTIHTLRGVGYILTETDMGQAE